MTFGGAGITFTSATTSWILYELGVHPDVQAKLRKEILDAPVDITMDGLSSLGYLDWVMRETLRLHPGIRLQERDVMCDTILPLSTPIINKKGQVVTQIQ